MEKHKLKEFCNICARQMYYQGCEGVTISMNYPPPRLQGLGQTGFDRAYLEEGEGGLEGARSGEGGGGRSGGVARKGGRDEEGKRDGYNPQPRG